MRLMKMWRVVVLLVLGIVTHEGSASSSAGCGAKIVEDTDSLSVEIDWPEAARVTPFWEKKAPELQAAGLLGSQTSLRLDKSLIRRGEIKDSNAYSSLLEEMSRYRVGAIWLANLGAFSQFLAGEDPQLAQVLFLSWTNEGGALRIFDPNHPRRRTGLDVVVSSMFLTPSQPIADILDPFFMKSDLNQFEIFITTLFYQHLNHLSWSLRGLNIRPDFETESLQKPISNQMGVTTLHRSANLTTLKNSLGNITLVWNSNDLDTPCVLVPGQWSDIVPKQRQLALVSVNDREVATLIRVEKARAERMLHFMGQWERQMGAYLRGGGVMDSTTEAIEFLLGAPEEPH